MLEKKQKQYIYIFGPIYKCYLEKPFRMWEAVGNPSLGERKQNLLQSD